MIKYKTKYFLNKISINLFNISNKLINLFNKCKIYYILTSSNISSKSTSELSIIFSIKEL